VTPKFIVRPPLAFKYYLKLEGARPMSKIFSCCRPIVTAAGYCDFLEKQTPPGGIFLFVT
jgi:hypothetical protein